MSSQVFLNGRVTLWPGDCIEVMQGFEADSFDACVTDPPYHLTSIVKRFGATNAAPAKSNGATGVYERSSRGFMSKIWDGGDIAFRPETWAEVLRVLKPGAHLIAFGAPKNYHRLGVAIEDGGFEIRDCLQWIFGSGFPKSHDVSKGIDKHGGAQVGWFGPWLRKWRADNGITQKQIAVLFPSKTGALTGCVANWELGLNMPTPEQFNLICETFGLPFKGIAEAEREIIGKKAVAPGVAFSSVGPREIDVTAPATDSAREWEGWGTALKPAYEPIILARKPLSESSIAANVLKWGTGAINIDGCRVGPTGGMGKIAEQLSEMQSDGGWGTKKFRTDDTIRGRFPANILHDGSDEVVEAFPESAPASDHKRHNGDFKSVAKGYDTAHITTGTVDAGGSAARFFYTAKADFEDRVGSRHPTVKPLDLMQYLVRLVTPRGGTILDPFAGTGTTAEAAWREGFSTVLIEREIEYVADIERRMALCLAGPDERARESIKARLKDNPVDHGPLFGGAAA